MTRLLLAEPDAAVAREIQHSCSDLSRIVVSRSFPDARVQLGNLRPEVLVTNLRLGDYNGLHLVLLASSANPQIRCIVYTDRPDLYLIREAQAIGAFYEQADRLVRALPGFLHAVLPPKDRRDPERHDRRAVFRGGRRSADQPVTAQRCAL